MKAVVEIRGGARAPEVEDGLRFGRVVTERRRRGAGGAEFGLGKVTAARAQVRRGVAQDVHELEALAEIRAEAAQVGESEMGAIWQMVQAEPRPEFADAAGDEIRVFLQLGGALEGDDMAAVAEALEVEGLAADDFLQHAHDLAAILLPERAEPGEAVVQTRDERAFAVVRRGDFVAQLLDAVRLAGADHLPESREMPQPRGDRHGGAVGDGVARPRQQIRQPDGCAQRRGQQPDAEVKRARDAGEQRPAEVCGVDPRGFHVGAHLRDDRGKINEARSFARSYFASTERTMIFPSAKFPRPACAALSSQAARLPMGGSLASLRQPSMSRKAWASRATGSLPA